MFPFKSTSFSKLFDRAPRSFSSIHTKSTQHTFKHSPQQATHRSNQSKLNSKSQSKFKKQPKRIKTFVRFRPLSLQQIEMSNSHINLSINSNQSVCINNNSYQFEKVFNQASSQLSVFQETTIHLIDNFFNGYDSTLMTYGQTGSGKTFTMFGDHRKGIISLTGEQVFKRLKSNSRLYCSGLQIYNQQLLDLINPDIKIKKLAPTIHQIKSISDFSSIINKCQELKKIRSTSLNDTSSRSHVIFIIYLQQEEGDQIIKSKFSLVDLAGNQRLDKSYPNIPNSNNHINSNNNNNNLNININQTKKINLSLSCLTKTIRALIKKQPYIPYRQSKLTQVLQDFLNGSLSLIITCSSHSSCLNETLNSIRFGVQSKRLETLGIKNLTNKNQSTIEKVLYDSLKSQLQNYEQKINRIKQIIQCGMVDQSHNKYFKQINKILDDKKQVKILDEISIPNFKFPQDSSQYPICNSNFHSNFDMNSNFNSTILSINTKNLQISKLQQQINDLRSQISTYKQLIQPIQKQLKIQYLIFQKQVLICQIDKLQNNHHNQKNNQIDQIISSIKQKDEYISQLQKKIQTLSLLLKNKGNTKQNYCQKYGRKLLKIRKLNIK